jgi:hypothetical protein
MEISPIRGIRMLPAAKVPPADSDLSRVFDIENSARPGDDTYSGSGKKSAGGEDEETETVEAETIEESREAAAPAAPEEASDSKVNFFA